MAAPNRKEYVEKALAKLGQHTRVVPASMGDTIRKQFLPYVWEEFPDKQDWALMVKKDRGNEVTSDIMFHIPTKSHVDVMTNDDANDKSFTIIKAAWSDYGTNDKIQNGTWYPISVSDAIAQGKVVKFPIGGIPENPPSNPPNLDELKAKLSELIDATHVLANRIDENSIAIRNVTHNQSELARGMQILLDKPNPDVPNIKFPTYRGRIFGVTITLTPDE